MGDQAEIWREYKRYQKERREKLGVRCPDCTVRLPKAHPKILMPGQKCWCGYKDSRAKESNA